MLLPPGLTMVMAGKVAGATVAAGKLSGVSNAQIKKIPATK